MKLQWHIGAIAPFLISVTKGGPGVWKWVECSPALSLLAPLLMTNLMKVRICQVSKTILFLYTHEQNKDISASTSTSLSTSTIDKPSLRMTKWRNILRNLNAINQILYRLRFYGNWMFEEDIRFESCLKVSKRFIYVSAQKVIMRNKYNGQVWPKKRRAIFLTSDLMKPIEGQRGHQAPLLSKIFPLFFAASATGRG